MSDPEKTVKKIDETVKSKVDEADETVSEATATTSSRIEEGIEEAKEVAHDLANSEYAKKADEALSELSAKAKNTLSEAQSEAHSASEAIKEASKKYSENVVEELKDPAVSTTVLFTAVTASAASTYLTQQHKQGSLSTVLAAGVLFGVAALSVAEYFSVKAYFRRSNSSGP